MAHNLPPQSSFLYASNWTPELDSLLLGTMIRLKIDNNWDGTVFPSNFILEAESVIKQKLGYAFDWAALYDRLHFLEKRYKTFKEMLQVNGTYWDARTNLVIPGEGVWMEILPRNPLAGAYLSHGDPAYHMLADLFAHNDVKVEREKTVIMISDSSESCNNDFVVRKQTHYGRVTTTMELLNRSQVIMFASNLCLRRDPHLICYQQTTGDQPTIRWVKMEKCLRKLKMNTPMGRALVR
ncbi:hypothetical protein AAHA92_14113 [Salvia divinorum]|uniref:Myb/SANT-like domain-containing protein n=1 Tax=Salvia divinorum TaxID=28513 RepID=A0ABD1HEJ3_SALDI